MSSIQFGASRPFLYPPDRHSDQASRPTARDSKPKSIAEAWAVVRDLATQGNPMAAFIVKIDAAMQAEKKAKATGEPVPAWAREALVFINDDDDDDSLDDALSALTAALR